MPRVKRGTTTHKRHAKILELAKGYRTGRHTLVRRASEAVLKAGNYAYRDRRTKKRDMRGAWILRINAAVRQHGLTYSTFIHALHEAGIMLDRKVMSQMIAVDPESFHALIKKVQPA